MNDIDARVGVHDDRHPELAEVRGSLTELRDDLGPHVKREERVLFPMFRALMSPKMRPTMSVRTPIAVLCAEDDRAGELLQVLRTQTPGYVTLWVPKTRPGMLTRRFARHDRTLAMLPVHPELARRP
jgi:regulator of cell morphogenesis and NO signaling